MKMIAVIGANYGDEGKGRVVDYLASVEKDPLVVRFNGGAQAGHRVVTSTHDHIFSHFGSGTFRGVDTYLSENFVVNPILFETEYKQLNRHITTWVDRKCMVTTPYDMMLNTSLENMRGAARHGSCGVGFGATIERTCDFFDLRVSDLDSSGLFKRLQAIRDRYFKPKALALGVLENDAIFSDNIIHNFIDSVKFMLSNIYTTDVRIMKNFETLIFEGAQGLMLDQHMGYFPYVTRSNTGLRNIVSLIGSKNPLDVMYVTRCYTTRHGPGIFPEEGSVDVDNSNEKNVTNEYQGIFRKGPLNMRNLMEAIVKDRQTCGHVKVRSQKLVVTCLDQIQENFNWNWEAGQRETGNIVERLKSWFDIGLVCSGPTAKDTQDLR